MIARFSDLCAGICCCHPPIPCIPMAGIIITGDGSVLTNNLPTARTFDIAIGFCGHPSVIVTSSETAFVSNLGLARIGDAVAGCLIGVIVTASADSLSS